MARIKLLRLFAEKGQRTLATGPSIAPYASFLVLVAPAACCDRQCNCLWLCVGLGVVSAAVVYVLFGLARELRLLTIRLPF